MWVLVVNSHFIKQTSTFKVAHVGLTSNMLLCPPVSIKRMFGAVLYILLPQEASKDLIQTSTSHQSFIAPKSDKLCNKILALCGAKKLVGCSFDDPWCIGICSTFLEPSNLLSLETISRGHSIMFKVYMGHLKSASLLHKMWINHEHLYVAVQIT